MHFGVRMEEANQCLLVVLGATAEGCGVVAKPILAILAREPAVAEAWLNRNGTIVAVVWKEGIAPELDEAAYTALQEAVALGHRPLTGEQ